MGVGTAGIFFCAKVEKEIVIPTAIAIHRVALR
jgi:hypothetical protein